MLMNVDLYKKTMTGKDIVISIIDTGVNIESSTIEHYYCTEGEIIPGKNAGIKDNHGTLCAKQITEVAKDSTLVDINVLNSFNKITEENIIMAIEFLIERQVDIINISLKLENYSNALYEVCNRAIKSNIAIIAATDKKLSFPADFEDVIKISTDNQEAEIKVIGKNHISINNFAFQCDINDKHYNVPESSSIACAYFSGIMALVLEANPFISNQEVQDRLFAGAEPEEMNIVYNKVIQAGTAVIVTSGTAMKLCKNTDIMKKEVTGFYDFSIKKFVNCNNEIIGENEITNIIEINPTEKEKVLIPIPDVFADKTVKYAGTFIKAEPYEKIMLRNHYTTTSNYISNVNTPTIMIASFGYGSSKFDLQVELFRQFKEKSINPHCITYNPLGILLDFFVYEYPKQVIFPDIVYSINRDMAEIEKYSCTELFIVDIAGSITLLNNHNVNNFGTLFDAFTKAVRADIVLLCINQGIRTEAVAFELERMKLLGIPEVILIVSENHYDETTMDSSTGIKYVLSDETQKNKFYNKLKQRFPHNQVFAYDTENKELVNRILQLLT